MLPVSRWLVVVAASTLCHKAAQVERVWSLRPYPVGACGTKYSRRALSRGHARFGRIKIHPFCVLNAMGGLRRGHSVRPPCIRYHDLFRRTHAVPIPIQRGAIPLLRLSIEVTSVVSSLFSSRRSWAGDASIGHRQYYRM